VNNSFFRYLIYVKKQKFMNLSRQLNQVILFGPSRAGVPSTRDRHWEGAFG
jgi:hypothetical protein